MLAMFLMNLGTRLTSLGFRVVKFGCELDFVMDRERYPSQIFMGVTKCSQFFSGDLGSRLTSLGFRVFTCGC